MQTHAFTAVKLQTVDIAACETFFGSVFGFQVTHRYGGGEGDPFQEIVMTLRGNQGMMLKFIQNKHEPASAAGVTIQIKLDEIEPTMVAAVAARATVAMEPTDYPEAAVRMAVITSDQGFDIELVQDL